MRRIGLFIIGMVLVLVGIPMLVLPGPGLLAIGGGAWCIARAFSPRRSQS